MTVPAPANAWNPVLSAGALGRPGATFLDCVSGSLLSFVAGLLAFPCAFAFVVLRGAGSHAFLQNHTDMQGGKARPNLDPAPPPVPSPPPHTQVNYPRLPRVRRSLLLRWVVMFFSLASVELLL